MRQHLPYFYLIFSFLCCLMPCTGEAFDLGDYLTVNGFLSQGYIKSEGNNFLADSKNGTFEINEAALTLNSQVSDRLRIGMQFLSRDLGEEGDNEVLLDWGMADYRWRDWLGIRIGKVKLPIGLYNQGRDSDFLRPMAFLPQSIYDENKRNLVVAAVGGSLYGNLSLGSFGDLEYQGYYGEVNFPEDSGQARGMKNQAALVARQKGLGEITSFSANNKYVFGGALVYEPPIEGLRLGFSFFEGKTDFDVGLTRYDQVDPDTGRSIIVTTQGSAEGNNKAFIVFSLEYSLPRLTLAAEYTEFSPDRQILGVSFDDTRSQGWYVMGSYRLLDELALSVLYDVFYADKDDKDGDQFASRGQPDFLGWRKDFGIGIRYDIDYNWLIKAEWHSVSGASLQLPIFNPGGVEENWSYFVLKASFNF